MKVVDYRKRVEHSDSLTDDKEPEKVEKMVGVSLLSTGRVWPSTLLSMEQTSEEACLMKNAINGI